MASYNQVSYGSKGSDVSELQKLLNQNGYGLDVDGDFGTKTQAAVKDYQQKNNLDVDGIVGENTWGSLTKPSDPVSSPQEVPIQTEKPSNSIISQPSNVVQQAQAMLQQQISQKPGGYQSGWNSQLTDTIQKILNREKFDYDVTADPLFHEFRDQYTTGGKMAMMDTMGQAAAMTGGYGNSYAQMAGQQAYQGYLQDLNDRIPEFYGMALDRYNLEGDRLAQEYSLLSDREAQDYGRYEDAYNRWLTERDFAYQMDRDQVAQEQWEKEFAEDNRRWELLNSGTGGSGGSSGGSGGGLDGYGDDSIAEDEETTGDAEPDVNKLSRSQIESIQRYMGLPVDGTWDFNDREAAGGRTPGQVWDLLRMDIGAYEASEYSNPVGFKDGDLDKAEKRELYKPKNSDISLSSYAKSIIDTAKEKGWDRDDLEKTIVDEVNNGNMPETDALSIILYLGL